jgi:hypothetical protein
MEMTAIEINKHIETITECAGEIHKNACAALYQWKRGTRHKDERARILMELRHDLKDAFEAVEAPEESEEV